MQFGGASFGRGEGHCIIVGPIAYSKCIQIGVIQIRCGVERELTIGYIKSDQQYTIRSFIIVYIND